MSTAPVSNSTSNHRLGHRGLLGTCCVGAVVIAATWALWPLGPNDAAAAALAHTKPAARRTTPPQPLELAAFRTPLWVAPPPPPPAPTPPPPPPPLKLQLIAIVTEPAGAPHPRAALVYDPDQDKLLTLRQGDAIGGRSIIRITEEDVQIKDASGTRTLALRSDSPAAGGRP